MVSVVGHLEGLGVRVHYIPLGCTPLAQPIDVGVACPFKQQIHREWDFWMAYILLDLIEIFPTPHRREITHWVCHACEGIG